MGGYAVMTWRIGDRHLLATSSPETTLNKNLMQGDVASSGGEAWQSRTNTLRQKISVIGLFGIVTSAGPSNILLAQCLWCLAKFFCVVTYSL